MQLTGVIECTAVLFEHLVELTQGVDEAGKPVAGRADAAKLRFVAGTAEQ